MTRLRLGNHLLATLLSQLLQTLSAVTEVDLSEEWVGRATERDFRPPVECPPHPVIKSLELEGTLGHLNLDLTLLPSLTSMVVRASVDSPGHRIDFHIPHSGKTMALEDLVLISVTTDVARCLSAVAVQCPRLECVSLVDVREPLQNSPPGTLAVSSPFATTSFTRLRFFSVDFALESDEQSRNRADCIPAIRTLLGQRLPALRSFRYLDPRETFWPPSVATPDKGWLPRALFAAAAALTGVVLNLKHVREPDDVLLLLNRGYRQLTYIDLHFGDSRDGEIVLDERHVRCLATARAVVLDACTIHVDDDAKLQHALMGVPTQLMEWKTKLVAADLAFLAPLLSSCLPSLAWIELSTRKPLVTDDYGVACRNAVQGKSIPRLHAVSISCGTDASSDELVESDPFAENLREAFRSALTSSAVVS
jgi:hypothetical protein